MQLAVIVFESLCQIVLSLRATRRRNIVHAAGICFNNLSILIMLVLGMLQLKDSYLGSTREAIIFFGPEATSQVAASELHYPVGSYFVGLIIVFAIETVVLGGITWKLYGEFSW